MVTFTWPLTLSDISMANNQNECMSVLYMRAMNTTTALTWHTITVAVTVADYHFSIHSYKACNWIIKKSTRFHTVASHVPFSNVLFVYLILHKTCSLSYSYTFHFIHTHLCLQILYTHAPISSIHQHTHKLQSHPHTHTGSNLTHTYTGSHLIHPHAHRHILWSHPYTNVRRMGWLLQEPDVVGWEDAHTSPNPALPPVVLLGCACQHFNLITWNNTSLCSP